MTAFRLPPDAKIALLSPSGWGNLGDLAIIESLIQGIRQRVAHPRLMAFTQNPAVTSLQHGIEAYSCLGFSAGWYAIREPQGDSLDDRIGGGARTRGMLRWIWDVVRRVWRHLPLAEAVRTWLIAPVRFLQDKAHLRRSRELLRGASLVVVAGGGQLDDSYGGALGHPYVLWRWARLARSVGARFVVASVGTGSLSRASRSFVIRALRLASYRSYRDGMSRTLLRAPDLTRDDAIVPDLAYALRFRPTPPPGGDRLVVGLSPMDFGHALNWPQADPGRYERHVRSFGRLAAHLLADGHAVVIFTTAPDVAAADILGHLGISDPDVRMRVCKTDTLESLFQVLDGVDVVVAARLHGVLLAHLARRPALAVSHERKVRTLMEEMGQLRYCYDIDEFDPDDGYARLKELIAMRTALGDEIGRKVAEYRSRVLAQYDLLFGPDPPVTAAIPEHSLNRAATDAQRC